MLAFAAFLTSVRMSSTIRASRNHSDSEEYHWVVEKGCGSQSASALGRLDVDDLSRVARHRGGERALRPSSAALEPGLPGDHRPGLRPRGTEGGMQSVSGV